MVKTLQCLIEFQINYYLTHIKKRLLSSSGLLYSMGKENSEGQLGHGDSTPRNLPTLIEKLKTMKEMIKTVSCGFKHVIAKTGLGKVYSWGSNAFGQLGLGHFLNQMTPKIVNTDKLSPVKFKVNQVRAGFRSSMILYDDGKVFWCGKTGAIERSSFFTQLDYKSKIGVIYYLF